MCKDIVGPGETYIKYKDDIFCCESCLGDYLVSQAVIREIYIPTDEEEEAREKEEY